MAEAATRCHFYSFCCVFTFYINIFSHILQPLIWHSRTFVSLVFFFWSILTIIHFVRYAVVTGSNKGIGLETVRQLASKGVKVVLTARDEKKGLEAVQKLKDSGLSDLVLFHQLDVDNPASIASLADFINTQFGRLDIVVEILSLSLSLSLYIYIYIYVCVCMYHVCILNVFILKLQKN